MDCYEIILPVDKTLTGVTAGKEKTFEQSEKFNNYFANIGVDLASKIPVSHELLSKQRNIDSSFHFSAVTEKDVLKEIQLLKNKPSCGIDGISAQILKISAPVILPSLI